MTMKSPSTMHLLPTGGLSRCRLSSIHFWKLIGGVSISTGFRNGGDALQFDRDRRRECADSQCRSARLCGREVFGVDLVVGGKVARHVGEEHGDIDEILPAPTGRGEDRAHIREHGV